MAGHPRKISFEQIYKQAGGKVDDDDLHFLNTIRWSLCRKRNAFYAVHKIKINEKVKTTYLSRLIMQKSLGRILDKTEIVDHINRNSLDNRKVNLRIVNELNNRRNHNLYKTNTSGTSGIYFAKSRNRWVVRIWMKGIRISLGSFKTKEEAVSVRKDAEKLLWGEFAPK